MHLASPTPTYFDATFLNVGPITTTYTAPAACTPTPVEWLGVITDSGPASGLMMNLGPLGCDGQVNIQTQCLPSESEVYKTHSDLSNRQHNYATYYSPAAVCPAGWETKGIAAAVDKSSTSSSGEIFHATLPPDLPDISNYFRRLPYADYFIHNLEPSETAIFCCPTGYKAYFSGDLCYSPRPAPKDITSSTLCFQAAEDWNQTTSTFTAVHGTSYLPPIISFGDAASPITSVAGEPTPLSNYPLPTSSGESLVVAKVVPILALVHKAGDVIDKKNGGSALSAVPFAAWFAAALCSLFVL